jgi:hypothetical protein
MMQEGLNEIRFPSAMYLGWNMSREFLILHTIDIARILMLHADIARILNEM